MQIKSLGSRKNQEWLLIADVVKGQWTPASCKKESETNKTARNDKMVLVPNNTTNHFLGGKLKRQSPSAEEHTKLGHERSGTKTIRKWKATRERRDRYTIECYQSLHAKWITSFYDCMQNNRQIVLNGWEKSRITKFLKFDAGDW